MAQSMSYNQAAGLGGMLKKGHKSMEGLQGATLRNVEACHEISTITRTSLGPNGMNKLVVNHLGKIIVTSDCATIVKELEIEHPAAKMLQLAAEAQDFECGDGTNLVVSFAGELLSQTEDLFRMGLHPSDVVAGFTKAGEKLMEDFLPPLAELITPMADGRVKEELERVVKPVLAAKQLGSEDVLAPLVAEACLGTMSSSGAASFSAESVRVAKILGGDISQSHVVHGFVALRGLETTLSTAKDAKIVVFGCGIEASATEAKGTVLMKNADDLKNYNKSEEKKMEEIIKSIADSGVKVLVAGGSVSEMALHFIERYGMLCLRIGSKWELRRLCVATGATALVRLGAPTPDEMGHCDHVYQKEVGGRPITVFAQGEGSKTSKLSTIVLRASTSSVLADLERAIDDGVHAARTSCKNGKLVPGAGATEMELSLKIGAFADTCPGLDQYAIRAFGKALEVVPRTLAENAGLDQGAVIAALVAAHASGKACAGVDIDAMGIDGATGVCDETKVYDLYQSKASAFRLAIDAALTVLRVDQIIMSKQAGGGGGGGGMPGM
jgi:T-complex protein 1 subunit theta